MLADLRPLLLLLVAALLWSPSRAQAQIVFDLQLSERGQEMVTDPDRMRPEELLEIVGEHGVVTYRGERPVEGHLVAYFLHGPSGTGKTLAARLGEFELRPGEYRLGEFLSRDRSLALFEELFPDGYFAAKELDFITGFGSFMPSDFPTFVAESVESSFEEVRLGEGQVGLALLFVPEDPDASEVQIRPMSFVLGPEKDDRK